MVMGVEGTADRQVTDLLREPTRIQWDLLFTSVDQDQFFHQDIEACHSGQFCDQDVLGDGVGERLNVGSLSFKLATHI